MPSGEEVSRRIVALHRWLPVAVFGGLAAAMVVLAVVRGAQGRWSDAGAISALAAFMLLTALGAAWWARRTADGPRWVRRLPADIRDDPARLREAANAAWQPRVASWVILALGIGGVVWSVAMHQWGALFWSVVTAAAVTRVLWRMYRPQQA